MLASIKQCPWILPNLASQPEWVGLQQGGQLSIVQPTPPVLCTALCGTTRWMTSSGVQGRAVIRTGLWTLHRNTVLCSSACVVLGDFVVPVLHRSKIITPCWPNKVPWIGYSTIYVIGPCKLLTLIQLQYYIPFWKFHQLWWDHQLLLGHPEGRPLHEV